MTSSLSGSRASVASSGVVMRTAGRKSPNLNRYSVQQSPSSTLGRKSKEDFRRSMISVAPSGGGNFNLDPQIDKRSAVKPSLVKKKKNTGVRFSLNYMLQKKQQKINNNWSCLLFVFIFCIFLLFFVKFMYDYLICSHLFCYGARYFLMTVSCSQALFLFFVKCIW